MRKPTDLCLLCHINAATKKNSHIFPRFISTSFLGSKGGPKRGFALDHETAKGKPARVIQDSPKEDFILCEECEAYFGILEGYSTSTFIRWREKIVDGTFTEDHITDFFSVVNCVGSDPDLIRLLVYSIFWRASISSHSLFDGYELSNETQALLRSTLLSTKAANLKELKEKVGATYIPNLPYAVFTTLEFKDRTENTLAAINSANPASLFVDQFAFILYANENDVKEDPCRPFMNAEKKDCRLMVLSWKIWHELMVRRLFQLVIDQGKANE